MTSYHQGVIASMPRLATAIVVAMTLAATVQPANALSGYLADFETQYPDADGTRIDTCGVCHTDIPQLNPYGTAFQGAGNEFEPIESDDSDGDGASNLAEIMALTFPGDPDDSPPQIHSPTPTETPLSEVTPTNTEQTGDTPTPTESPGQVPTNTSVSATVTPTTSSASPTNAVNTPTVTPGGAATVSPTTSLVRTRTRTAGGPRPASFEDDSCSIVAPERSSTGRGLLLLLTPALLLWASRRRL